MGLKGWLYVAAAAALIGIGWHYSAAVHDLVCVKHELEQTQAVDAVKDAQRGQVIAAETKQAAKEEQHAKAAEKQHREVHRYVEEIKSKASAVAPEFELDAHGMCIWRAANAGVEPACEPAQPDAVPAASATGKRADLRPGGESPGGRADVSPAMRSPGGPAGLSPREMNG